MLSREDNELLCRIGPGTPMGNLMRQYWVPAALSSELPEADGPPLRVRLLGEDLIGFRTTSGTVGLIQNSCPHRGACLFYGRNEDEGLRCVYHGWKFDVTGQCVDMPSEPLEQHLQDEGPRDGLPLRRARRRRSGPTWARARRRRRCPTSSPTCSPAARFRSTSASATGCRRSRATSTPATRCSCTCGHVAADDTAARHVRALRAHAIAPRATRWPTRTSA